MGATKRYDVVVIGAGFAGLYALHRFRDGLGLNVRVYESGDGIGGTWFWNRYPGARCDSESYYYCYSFSKELEQEWEWSSRYPAQPEILKYLHHVADRFDLRRDIQLSTRVAGAEYDDDANEWAVHLDGEAEVRARFVVSAVGCLSATNVPRIPGLDSFEGRWVHTANWPKQGVDFKGKRVGLIGTGSTGIQATPVIAEEAEHLTVFQRTANYTIPARNRPIPPEEWAGIKRRYDEIRDIQDRSEGGFPYLLEPKRALDVTEEEREQIFQRGWDEGGFAFFWGGFNDLLRDKDANDTAADFVRRKIREVVQDPDVAERLTPRDHPFGTKRPPIDTNYWATFNRENVDLVDIRKDPIVEITKKGLRTEDAQYELDVIVFATGFDAMTGSLLRMDLRGESGVRLADKWAAGPKTFLGLQVSGFPNFFLITGPGSPSVLFNMPTGIEQHVDWIGDCIEYMQKNGYSRIVANADAEARWIEHVNEVANDTLYREARSWYVGANIPGKPDVFMPYVGGQTMYKQHLNASVDGGYDGFTLR